MATNNMNCTTCLGGSGHCRGWQWTLSGAMAGRPSCVLLGLATSHAFASCSRRQADPKKKANNLGRTALFQVRGGDGDRSTQPQGRGTQCDADRSTHSALQGSWTHKSLGRGCLHYQARLPKGIKRRRIRQCRTRICHDAAAACRRRHVAVGADGVGGHCSSTTHRVLPQHTELPIVDAVYNWMQPQRPTATPNGRSVEVLLSNQAKCGVYMLADTEFVQPGWSPGEHRSRR